MSARASYAARLAQEARRFTLTRSELRSGIDRILRYVTWAIVPTAALLFASQLRAHGSWRSAMAGAVAGTVAMVPEGLVLLTSLAFSVAVVRLARQRVLVQELPAVEGLARVDVLCIDKTGTLTEGRLALDRIERIDEDLDPEPVLAALAAADPAPNATLLAIGQNLSTTDGWMVERTVPFSSARKWGAAAFVGHGAWVLGAPDILTNDADVAARVAASATTGARVLLLARAPRLDDDLPDELEPVALVVLADRVRPDAAQTLAYFAQQQVLGEGAQWGRSGDGGRDRREPWARGRRRTGRRAHAARRRSRCACRGAGTAQRVRPRHAAAEAVDGAGRCSAPGTRSR